MAKDPRTKCSLYSFSILDQLHKEETTIIRRTNRAANKERIDLSLLLVVKKTCIHSFLEPRYR